MLQVRSQKANYELAKGDNILAAIPINHWSDVKRYSFPYPMMNVLIECALLVVFAAFPFNQS